MHKLLTVTVSAVAFLGLAACSDTDQTTTQSVDPAVEDQTAPEPIEPSEDTATQGMEPETDGTSQ